MLSRVSKGFVYLLFFLLLPKMALGEGCIKLIKDVINGDIVEQDMHAYDAGIKRIIEGKIKFPNHLEKKRKASVDNGVLVKFLNYLVKWFRNKNQNEYSWHQMKKKSEIVSSANLFPGLIQKKIENVDPTAIKSVLSEEKINLLLKEMNLSSASDASLKQKEEMIDKSITSLISSIKSKHDGYPTKLKELFLEAEVVEYNRNWLKKNICST